MSGNKRNFLIRTIIMFVVTFIFIMIVNIHELNSLKFTTRNLHPVYVSMVIKIVASIITFIITIMFAMIMFNREVNFEHMTGLCSRRKLFVDLNNLISKRLQFTVCYIDFNDFKFVNDKYGHSAGDMLLKEFARRIRELKHKKIIGYRIGGDEFVVIIKNEEQVDECIQSILKISEKEVRITIKDYVKFSFAMGITRNDFVSNADEILKKADNNMYKKKRGSVNINM